MQPNRLQRVWPRLKPEILGRWQKLTEEELESCRFQFDRVIEAIRARYFIGRAHLTLEGEIRDWLDERIAHYEGTDSQDGPSGSQKQQRH